jgi:molybdate transport system ATP-binding protein
MIHLDVEVRRGDFIVRGELRTDAKVSGLFGPTGCGKTTLLLAMAGLLSPVRGRIEVAGTTLFDSPRGISLPPERRRIGMVFQDGRLFPHLTVAGNLRFAPAPAGVPGPSFSDIVELLDLAPILDRSVDEISGGQARLVAIGRALLTHPRVLLLDEPLTGIDSALRRRVLAYLLLLKRSLDIRVLLVSHVFSDFLALADEMAILRAGHIEAVGTPEEMMTTALAEKSEEPIETTLAGRVISGDSRLAVVDCSGARFELPLPEARDGAGAYVTVGAQEMILAVGAPPATSARNSLPGRVRAMRRSGSIVFVGVDVGPIVWAEVTERSVEELRLEPGREVHVLIKASALRGVVLG